MICSNCRQAPVCHIHQMLSGQSFAIESDIKRCSYYVARTVAESILEDSLAAEIVIPPAAETAKEKEKIKTEEAPSQVQDMFSDLLAPSDPPVIVDENAPKVLCPSCGKYVPELLMVDTLDGRTVCEECFDKEDDEKLLREAAEKATRRRNGEWN